MTPQVRFLTKGFLFALPLFVWVFTITLIDPFNYFRLFSLVSEQAKIENAAALNSLVFNMLKAAHSPHENLVIGDSRAESLPLDQIPKHTHHSLVANALKLNESIDLFYFAQRNRPLKSVVFTINFNQFNQFAYADRVESVKEMIRNPLLYLFDRNVAQAAYYVTKAALTKHKALSSTPPMNKDDFWAYMVSVRGREHYGRYRYPDALYKRIYEMVEFANAHGIAVTFIVVPHHADFQKRVREFGLVDDYLRFKQDLSRLNARVIDFDYVNDITTRRENFRDPIHYNQEIGSLIIREVFSGPLITGRLLNTEWARQCSQYVF